MGQKKKTALLFVVFIGSIFLLMMIATCAPGPTVAPEPKPVTSQPEAAATEAPKPEAKEVSPYAAELKPLSAAECGRCHMPVYNQIRTEGGKHQIECVNCHTKYHVYSPSKQNWKDIMPQCKTCHGVFHGDKFPTCSVCHSEPHAPKKQIAMSAELTKACADCHAKVTDQLRTNVSKHTKVACSTCHHQKHGYIPSCMECHTPHTEKMTVKDCLACHPVHSPLNITYAETVSNDLCGSCHKQVYDKLNASVSKHRLVACAKCHHSKHRYIPKCAECHGSPHGEALLKKFPNCLQCHIDVHNLPTKSAGK